MRHDEKEQRVTFLKVLSGVLKSREEVRVVRMEGQQKADGADKEKTEKIHEIRTCIPENRVRQQDGRLPEVFAQ